MNRDMPSVVANQITFALPARQFRLECEITRSRRLPSMDEIGARLLATFDELLPAEFQQYLGISDHEREVLIERLIEHRIASVNEEGALMLSEVARKAMRESPDGLPRLAETSSETVRPIFDLVTFGPIAEKPGSFSGLPELTPRNGDDAAPREPARQAFARNFPTLRQLHKVLKDTELYKISSCEAYRLLLVPVEAAFHVSLMPEPRLDWEIVFFEDKEPDRLNELNSAIRDRLADARIYPGATSIADFVAYMEDPVLARFLNNDGFDVAAYIRAIRGRRAAYPDDRTHSLIGPVYLAQNTESIISELEKGFSENRWHRPVEAYWFAPDVPFWAASSRVGDFVRSIDEMLAIEEGHGGLHALLHVQPGPAYYQLRNAHWKRLKSAITYSGGQPADRVELLVVPSGLAVAQYHVQVEPHSPVTLPVGFMTTDATRIQRVERLLQSRVRHFDAKAPLWGEEQLDRVRHKFLDV